MVASALLLPLAGCFVQTRKGPNGDKDVDISTPLGGMRVQTDATQVQNRVGLPLYPGAVLEKGDKKDNSSADVNMNFGPFHLRVLAMGFTSTDSPEKVRDFYKKALSQYSDVITCRKNETIGTPTRTGLGLTCKDDNHVNTKVGDKGNLNFTGGETEMKAGSPARQHVVSYEAKDGGTKFGLIYLELPHGDHDEAN